jgi:hypothetical protein
MLWRVRPSNPQAIFTAIVGAAIIVFGATQVHDSTAFYGVDADDRDR